MVRTGERKVSRKPVGLLIWGMDRHDVIRKATELQGKFRVHGQRVAIEKARYHSDITTHNGRYKQYEIPIEPLMKGSIRKRK
jgi:hypothetical protein